MTESRVGDERSGLHRLAHWDGLVAELATAIVVTDVAGMVVVWNQAATKLFGRDAADALGRQAVQLLFPPAFAIDAVAMATSVARGRRWVGEIDCKRKDGSLVRAHVTLSAVYDDNRAVIGFAGEARDLFDIRAAEDQTRDSERQFRSLPLRPAELLYVTDSNGIVKYVLPTVESALGYSADELTGTSAFDIAHPDDINHIREVFAALVADPTLRPTITYRARGKDGSWRWLENRLSNFIDDPILAGIVCSASEIHEATARLDGAVFSGEVEPQPKLPPSIRARAHAVGAPPYSAHTGRGNGDRRCGRSHCASRRQPRVALGCGERGLSGRHACRHELTRFHWVRCSWRTAGATQLRGRLPLRSATIRKALTVAPAGGTVVVRGGTYRESLGSISHTVTLQAYPHEQVWVKGSIVVHGFVADDGGWSMPFTSTACSTCYPTTALDPQFPAAGFPEQVFVDSAPVDQVVSKAALAPNTFFVDRTTNKLWLNDDPTGHTVEVTVLAKAFGVNPAAPDTAIKGIGFEHWATVYEGGTNVAGMSSAANVVFDHDTFAWSSTRALGIYGANNDVTNSRFVDNGMNGVSSNAIDRLDFERNEVAFSNYEHWSILPTPSAQLAGVRITGVTNAVFRANDFHDNVSNGLWIAELSSHQTIVNNKVRHNAGHGVILEMSGQSVVAGNLIAGNTRDGLKIAGANDVEVWNNTVVDNGSAQIGIYEVPGHTTGAATSDTTDVRIGNNIFQAGLNSTNPVLNSFDTSTPKHLTTLRMISADDHNDYGRTSAATPRYLMSTQSTLAKQATYLTLDAFRAATGREHASTNTDGWAPTTLFVQPEAGNYALRPGVSASLSAPATLPAAVAATLGGPATPTHIGAFAEVPRDVGVLPPYEVATVDDTNYPIPVGARYVANGGSDANPGSLGLPYATIRKALTVVPSGGTVVVRGGTYRESLGSIGHKVTVQAYPHEQVWVKGSVIANDFTAGSAGWSMPFTPMCANCYPTSEIDPSFPAAGLPEQVFVDGAPLEQAVSQATLSTKSFYVDRAGKEVVVAR